LLKDGRVMAPLDGSERSERALPYAAAFARALDAPLVLMMAAYVSDIPEHGPWTREMVAHPEQTCADYLRAVEQRLRLPASERVVKLGYPHEAILDAARECGASLIALSTHGRSGLNRWVYGSTAGHLLHASHVPLLVVGKDAADLAGTEYAPKHVLVPLDGSKLGEAALPPALEAAKAFGARLSLVRVAPFSVEAFPMTVPQMYWPELDKELVAGARAYLERVRATLNQPVDVQVMQGPRADSLLTFCETQAVDLVVMATHGRAGLQRAVLGSTANRMIEGAAPVLLVRPEDA
jgi:nucleotide-binding universal stress UspA family protein